MPRRHGPGLGVQSDARRWRVREFGVHGECAESGTCDYFAYSIEHDGRRRSFHVDSLGQWVHERLGGAVEMGEAATTDVRERYATAGSHYGRYRFCGKRPGLGVQSDTGRWHVREFGVHGECAESGACDYFACSSEDYRWRWSVYVDSLGSGFVNGSVVEWNGASRTTTYVLSRRRRWWIGAPGSITPK